MQIDFHDSQHSRRVRQVPTQVSRARLFWQRLGGALIAFIGCLLLLYIGTSLVLPKQASPYGILFFETRPSEEATVLPVRLVWIDEPRGTITITTLPGDLEFHSHTLGTYPLANAYLASQTLKQDPEELLSELSLYLRIPIRVAIVSQRSFANTKFALSRSLFSACLLRKTSLGPAGCIHDWLYVTMYGSIVRELSFPKSILVSGKFPPLQDIDRSVYRTWSQSNFMQSFEPWKKYTISVQNGTQTSGLATVATRYLQDFGLTILSIGETQSPIPSGSIAVTAQVSRDTEFVDFLSKTLRMPVRIDDTLAVLYRSSVVVQIGESERKYFAP